MSQLLAWAEAIEQSRVGLALAESALAFPLIEGAHLLGLALSFGLLAIADLRLLGLLLRQVPAHQVLRQLRPWIFGGFALTFITGGLLFWSEAAKILFNPAFVAKLVLTVLALANALVFETRLAPRAIEWGQALRLPTPVRLAGLASLTLWSGVLITGRLIPYL
ncbi:DUF6644 family protein [Paucibacter sp. Y2R2-4]|uniref:DUF6644 family protein n=1 Tax=Paucibacter sp. Y2R2-4 TaxID=2893553 RepID=UPI0021E4BA9A|nr:DUF6644 family protein [Paucibacter sp. Y2R2-4]MCV2348301.1 hypothetical protein [Paucibacter sp. Y2R2-4]